MSFYVPPDQSSFNQGIQGVNNAWNQAATDPNYPSGSGYGGSNVPAGWVPDGNGGWVPGDSGTSGGTAGDQVAAAPAPKPLASSPEWLAYLNALGLERGQFEADINRQRAGIGADTARQLANLPLTYDAQRRGITGGLEARGMSQSGQLLRELAQNRAAQGVAAGNIQAAGANQLSTLESQLAQKISDIGSRQSQEELTLRSQGYQ